MRLYCCNCGKVLDNEYDVDILACSCGHDWAILAHWDDTKETVVFDGLREIDSPPARPKDTKEAAEQWARANDPIDPIVAAYEQFKHLDTVLSDEEWVGNSVGRTCHLLWLAVKDYVASKNEPLDGEQS